jgi:hypothetical protein
LVADALTDSQPRRASAYTGSPAPEDDFEASDEGLVQQSSDGGVSESVIQDLKLAFGTDFNVDSALIEAILHRNCIAFVGSGFSRNETNITWWELIEKLLVSPCFTYHPTFRAAIFAM